MIHGFLEFLAEAVLMSWPFGEKRWWKLSVALIVGVVVAVVIGVTMGE